MLWYSHVFSLILGCSVFTAIPSIVGTPHLNTQVGTSPNYSWDDCQVGTEHRHLKLQLSIATVESVLLYGCEEWTLTSVLEKQLDGCYTRMLGGKITNPTQISISGFPSLVPKSAKEESATTTLSFHPASLSSGSPSKIEPKEVEVTLANCVMDHV